MSYTQHVIAHIMNLDASQWRVVCFGWLLARPVPLARPCSTLQCTKAWELESLVYEGFVSAYQLRCCALHPGC